MYFLPHQLVSYLLVYDFLVLLPMRAVLQYQHYVVLYLQLLFVVLVFISMLIVFYQIYQVPVLHPIEIFLVLV